MLKPPEILAKIDENVPLNDCGQCNLDSVTIIRKSAILRNKDVTAYYRNIFDNCDINKDGLVTISELREFIANQEGDEIPESVIKTLHSCFDQNKDEQLDFYEFLDMINHPTVGQTFKRVGSRYLKFVTLSSIRAKSLKLKRTITNTGLYEEEIVFSRYTIGMVLLSVIQIIFFYIDMGYVFPKSVDEIQHFNPRCMTATNVTRPIEEALYFNPCYRIEIWRYITHILLHLNTFHLYSNVVIQLLVGVPLELIHHWRIPVIYVAGAFGGCLAHSVINRNTILVGGSGGIYAFYTAHIATVILNWREMSHPIVHLIVFGIMTVFDAIRNYYLVTKAANLTNTTSYITHLGGAVVGLPLGLTILRNLKITKTERIVWRISAIVLIVLLTIFLTLNVSVDLMENMKA